MSETHFDVIVLGAGPGGYLAAERLGHAGKKVALVEEQYLGGTCLNVGCIPTKTLLNGAKNYLHAKEASQFGVDAQGVAVNWAQMQAWKDQVVRGLVAGVAATERKAGVTVINGRGHLDAPGRVTVEGTTYADRQRARLSALGSDKAILDYLQAQGDQIVYAYASYAQQHGVPQRPGHLQESLPILRRDLVALIADMLGGDRNAYYRARNEQDPEVLTALERLASPQWRPTK